METIEKAGNENATDDLENNIAGIKHKFIVISGKGGVGKTTVSVGLAYALALKGYKVGIMDVDIHGPNVNKMTGIKDNRLTGDGVKINPVKVLENLEVISTASILDNPDTPVIWRGPLKMKLIKQFIAEVNWGKLDYLIIDSPPGTGDEPLSVIQLISSLDGAIVVTTPQEVALLDARKSIQFAKKLNVPYVALIENMSGLVCPFCSKQIDLFGTGRAKKAAKELNIMFLGEIPMDPEVIKLSDKGKMLEVIKNKTSVSDAIMKIAENIIKYTEGKGHI